MEYRWRGIELAHDAGDTNADVIELRKSTSLELGDLDRPDIAVRRLTWERNRATRAHSLGRVPTENLVQLSIHTIEDEDPLPAA